MTDHAELVKSLRTTASRMAQGALSDNRWAPFRHQRALIWASTLSFVSILLGFWAWIPSWMHSSRLSGLLFLLPFLLPYGFIPLRLLNRRVFTGLTLAFAIGCALFVPGLYVIRFLFKWERNWWILGNLVLALLMQPVLVVIAAMTLTTISRPAKWRAKFLGSLAYGVWLFGLFRLFYSPIPYQIRENERLAETYLCEAASHANVSALYNGGLYPIASVDLPSVAESTCEKDGLGVVDPKHPSDGYVFEYVGISPSITAEGCKRFKAFTMSARPMAYGRTGFRSFSVDNNMEVHATSEDRPANPSDPIVRRPIDCPRHTPA